MQLFDQLETRYGLPAGLLDSVWSAESGRGRAMVSPAGAEGHFQFMPGTARQYGLSDPYDLATSADAAARMYADLLKQTGGALPQALAAYNWGIGNLQRKGMAAAPAETRNYVKKVTSAMGQPQAQTADPVDAQWASLAEKFGQGPAQSKAAAPADPWAEINAQFAQQPAQATAPSRAPTRPAPTESSTPAGAGWEKNLSRAALAAVPVVGPSLAMMDADPRGMALGIASGFADIGNTILNHDAKIGAELQRPPQRGASSLVTGGVPTPIERENAERQAALKAFNAENASPSFTGGRLVGNIAATYPVGGAVGPLFKGAAALPGLSRAAPVLNALGEATATGGMRTGLAPSTTLGRAANMGARMAGGAINGAASAGLVDPESAGVGAVVGGAVPPVVRGLGAAGDLAGRGIRALRTPESAKAAGTILDVGGYRSPEEIAAVRAALAQQGPNIVAEAPTVPQILQNPGLSQLQRTLRNAGETALLEREAAQNASRLSALDRVSPVTGTRQQAAENFGNTLIPEVRAADEAARRRVEGAFESVDPFGETRFELPIGEMQAAADRYLGRGTFGARGSVDQALRTARQIGEETIDALTPTTAGSAAGRPTLEQAVRRAGGINASAPSSQGLAGELRDLRQSGLSRVVSNNRGQSVDRLAQQMHEAGYIPDDDPATLLNALRDPDARRAVSMEADQSRVMQALRESAQGDAPGATTVARPVNFQEVQNLRSSISEAHADAQMRGRSREAAALDQMRRDIDARVNRVAEGQGNVGENFPSDMVETWRDAVAQHADRMQRFRTGPQASIFRQGGDGLPAAQGGELAPKFFSSRPSQTDDMAAFNLIASPQTRALLKNYAITDAAGQTAAGGALTNAKLGKWLSSRSGAIGGLFDDAERATLQGVGRDVARADSATNLGRAVGSNTAQNAISAGVLENPGLAWMANRTPLVRHFSGPLLSAMKEGAKRQKVERLSGLLADPVSLDQAIASYLAKTATRPALLDRTANPGLLTMRVPGLLADPDQR